jgi:hypothetical protein
MVFATMLGHLEHSKSPIFSYFSSLFTSQLPHNTPVYPVSHLTGWLFSGWYPPSHAEVLGHSTTFDEFVVLRQKSWLTSICVPPSHIASSKQLSHDGEFHEKEYVPGEHSFQEFEFVWYSPGAQYLNETVIVLSLTEDPIEASFASFIELDFDWNFTFFLPGWLTNWMLEKTPFPFVTFNE